MDYIIIYLLSLLFSLLFLLLYCCYHVFIFICVNRQFLDETDTYVAAGVDTNASRGSAQPPCRDDRAVVTEGNSLSKRQQCKRGDQVQRLH